MSFFFSQLRTDVFESSAFSIEIWDASNAPSSLISRPITDLVNTPSAECKKNMQCRDNVYLLSETFFISYPIFHNVSFAIFGGPIICLLLLIWSPFHQMVDKVGRWKLNSQWIHLILRQGATLRYVYWSLFKTCKVNDKKRKALYMKLLIMWIKDLQICFYW